MENCKGCETLKCPVLNRNECPIKEILESKSRLLEEAEELMTGIKNRKKGGLNNGRI